MSEDKKNREHDELLTRTTNMNDDIKLIKTHQWQATYYSLLLSAGVISFFSLGPVQSSHLLAAFKLAAIAISVFQILAIIFFQSSFTCAIHEYRDSGRAIDSLLKTGVKTKLDILAVPRDEWFKSMERCLYTIVFFVFGILGPLASLAYVYFANWCTR
jgi:hypothetical protein